MEHCTVPSLPDPASTPQCESQSLAGVVVQLPVAWCARREIKIASTIPRHHNIDDYSLYCSPQGGVAGQYCAGGGSPLQLPSPLVQKTLPGLPDPLATPHSVAQPVAGSTLQEPISTHNMVWILMQYIQIDSMPQSEYNGDMEKTIGTCVTWIRSRRYQI